MSNIKLDFSKTNIKLDLPPEEITKTGKSSLEVTNTSKYIFKREK